MATSIAGKRIFALINCCALCFVSLLQTPLRALASVDQPLPSATLVKDIGTAPAAVGSFCGSNSYLATLNGVALLALSSSTTGCELWRSDGTAAGTTLVKDIFPGAQGGFASYSPLVFGSRLYFVADNGALGRELWESDGTAAGTKIVSEVCPGECSGGIYAMFNVAGRLVVLEREGNGGGGYQLWVRASSNGNLQKIGPSYADVEYTAVLNNKLLFSCADVTRAETELCVTDGTSAGTVLLADIRAGAAGSRPVQFFALQNRVVFFADNGSTGRELWATDGTAANTALVMDIRPGAVGSEPENPLVITNFSSQPTTLIFAANDGASGKELWRSDGTTANTAIVKDWAPGSAGSDPRPIGATSVSGFYSVNTTATGREPVIVSLGGGVSVSLGDLAPGAASSDPFGFFTDGSTVFFSASTPSLGRELWRTTIGGAAATISADLSAGGADTFFSTGLMHQGRLYASAQLPGAGYELIGASDTASAGIIKDIRPGANGSSPRGFFVYSNTLFFTATTDDAGEELWRSDGSAAGTQLFVNIASDSRSASADSPWRVTPDGALLLRACDGIARGSDNPEGCGLWRSEGTLTSTVLLTITPDISLYPLTADWIGGKLVFVGGSSANREPHVTDGTAAGTFLLGDFNPAGASDPFPIRRIGDAIYFQIRSGPGADVVWRTDGTPLNTKPTSITLSLFGDMSGDIYFYQEGDQLRRSDATLSNTTLLKTLPDVSARDNIDFTPAAPGQVYFVVTRNSNSGARPTDLWFSDGTAEGTRFVKTLTPIENRGYAPQLTFVNGLMFFVTEIDGAGLELWKSDGSQGNTVRVRDIFAGPGGSAPRNLTLYQGKVYFSATDTDSRRLLYVSDGSEAGTRAVRADSEAPTIPDDIIATRGGLLFSAFDPAHGVELWRSDGSTAGTQLQQDILPGPENSAPLNFTNAGRTLFFLATTPQTGQELWAIAQAIEIRLPAVFRN